MKRYKFLFLFLVCLTLLNITTTAQAYDDSASSKDDKSFEVAFFIPKFDKEFVNKYKKMNDIKKAGTKRSIKYQTAKNKTLISIN